MYHIFINNPEKSLGLTSFITKIIALAGFIQAFNSNQQLKHCATKTIKGVKIKVN